MKLSATTEAQAYGILLDPQVDTAAAFGDGSVTGSIARSGTFRGSALIVPTGVDAGLSRVALRGRGIFLEGPIPVPAALAAREGRAESESERSEPPPPAQSPWGAGRSERKGK